ncbi:MAG: metal-sulfur cluster assembly factor [Candidatus Micrarchaeia archaeon]
MAAEKNPAKKSSGKISEKDVLGALKAVIDPEIGIDIVDLGLVYEIKIDAENSVHVKMTLTTPFCPLGPMILNNAERAVQGIKGVKSAKVELVFEPPWTPDRMSTEAKKSLGFTQPAQTP